MKRLRFIVILISSLAYNSDTLANQIFSVKSDSHLHLLGLEDQYAYADSCIELAWEYRDLRADSALYFAQLGRQLAQKSKFVSLEIKAINFTGIAYRNLGNLSKAVEYYLLALDLAEETNDLEQRGYSLINLGNLYDFQSNHYEAIRYLTLALDQAEELDNRRMLGYCYNNLGKAYSGLKAYAQAAEYFIRAIKIRNDLNDQSGQVSSEIDLAEVYLEQGDLIKAESTARNCFFKLKALNKPRKSAELHLTLAKIKVGQDMINSAMRLADAALSISQKVSADYELGKAHLVLSDIYKSTGDYKLAYEHQLAYNMINEKLLGEQTIRKTEQLISHYENSQQRIENEYLRKQDEFNESVINNQRFTITISIIGIIILLIGIGVIMRGYRIKKRLSHKIAKQRDRMEVDKALIEQQSQGLRDSDQAKSKFFANVAHDLRSPLSLILGNLQILKSENKDSLSTLSNYSLDTSLKNCKRLLFLTDEINDLTRLEGGNIILNLEEVRIIGYFKMLTKLFLGIARGKGVNLLFQSDLPETTSVKIDPRQFEKVFYNLVSNALNHTKTGDHITITIGADSNGHIFLNFGDTGEGIMEENLNNIFDRFYQGGGNMSNTGLGIGLALVKEIVDLHKGSISVKSKRGVGTNFEITLENSERCVSLIDATHTSSFDYVLERKHLYDVVEIDYQSEKTSHSTYRKSILLVDNQVETRHEIGKILEDSYDLIEAEHGLEALELLKSNSIDLIITGLKMPWMDGLEFMDQLSRSEDFRSIPKIVISEEIAEQGKVNEKNLGVCYFITRPLNKEAILHQVNILIEELEIVKI